jgi:uncharacterized protein
MSTERKFEILDATLGELLRDGLVVAFSGGVDSAFLLWAAERARRARGIGPEKLLALTAVSASMAATERDDARRFAEELGVGHRWEESRELENPAYAANDARRCYHCKTELFRIAGDVALAGGQRWLAYGYNASDRGDFRPGHQAAEERGVLAPLADAGLEKNEIRALMRANGLNLAEKPASPCLSSRLMTGVAVTPEKLADVEAMETLLREGGLKVFRVRLHEEGAARFLRLEIAPEEMEGAVRLRESLAAEGTKRGYRWVTLDLAGYRMGGGRAT